MKLPAYLYLLLKANISHPAASDLRGSRRFSFHGWLHRRISMLFVRVMHHAFVFLRLVILKRGLSPGGRGNRPERNAS
eukprot:16448299-Heterocapsa_arctica.AAC.1